MNTHTTITIICSIFILQISAQAAPRDIQIKSVDFTTSVMELHNFGTSTEDLDGWRFCSHDEDQTRRYSSSGGLNGESIAPGESLFIHFSNDAPAGDSTRINISSVGSVATPLDRGPYAIQLYFPPVSFGNGNAIADHLQWSIDGVDNGNADERSDEAQNGGVWVNQSQWIATTATSSLLVLTDTTGGVLHSPANYEIDPVAPGPEPVEIGSISVSETGEVTLTWPDAANESYEIRRSTNLLSFSLIGTTTEGTFTDEEAPADAAFYKIISSIPE